MNAFDRMAPQVSVISKIPQGNINHDAWRVALWNQMKQMLVMLGEISTEQLKSEYPDGIPIEFDPEHLPALSRNQVIFYDETHLEYEGGSTTTTGYQIRFPRDSEGRYSSPRKYRGSYHRGLDGDEFRFSEHDGNGECSSRRRRATTGRQECRHECLRSNGATSERHIQNTSREYKS